MGNVRLRGHDYHGKGFYFVTLTTSRRIHWFSSIVGGQVVLKPAGDLLLQAWQKIPLEDPAYELGVTAVMPDHFHAIIICNGSPKYALGTHMNRMKGRVLHALRKQDNQPGLSVWENGFYDYVSLDSKMLAAFRHYIVENPARWQLRLDHPEWFKKQYALQHPRLPVDTQWTAYGDATLLEAPVLVPVIISTRISETEREQQIRSILQQVERGALPIGGFISPGERAVAKAVFGIPRARIIKLEPWGLRRYKPHGDQAVRWIAEGRTLVLTGFGDDEPAECHRVNCLRNNEWVKAIAAVALG